MVEGEVGGSVVTQRYSEASAGQGDNGKHIYIYIYKGRGKTGREVNR
jgi:hypothetical protein